MKGSLPTKKKFTVSPAPHFFSGRTIPKVMWTVAAALLPALAASVIFFGWRAVRLQAAAVAAAVVTEAVISRLRRRPLTIGDGSAVVTGLLLAFNLPPDVPAWLAAAGAVFAIAVVKQAFGGLGFNIFNPALGGRLFVAHSWLSRMTTFTPPLTAETAGLDAMTYATPLGAAREALVERIPSLWNMFIGNTGGCIGETSALAILLGGMVLLSMGYISWRIPAAYLGSVALLTWLLPVGEGAVALSPLEHLFSGGLMLGAVFMATDMVTTPVSGKGMLAFGLGCGTITAVFRLYGGNPEGVSYSILIMNAFTPLIDRFTRPRVFGTLKKGLWPRKA